jgi:Domain of unknown function (DUF5122) beta-propeller
VRQRRWLSHPSSRVRGEAQPLGLCPRALGFPSQNKKGSGRPRWEGLEGKVTTNFTPGREQASGLAIQANGKLVAAGEARATRSRTFALARYKTDGTLDSTFSRNGKVLTDLTSKEDVAWPGRPRPLQGRDSQR